MASKKRILEILTTQTKPIKLKRLGEILGEPISNFQTQVDRMEKESPPLVLRNEDSEYTITEEGRRDASAIMKYSFPLSKSVIADVVISGPTINQKEVEMLCKYVALAKEALQDQRQPSRKDWGLLFWKRKRAGGQ